MPQARHVTARDGDVLLLVGTMKGAFLFRSDRGRARWERRRPLLPRPGGLRAGLRPARRPPRACGRARRATHWGAVLPSSDDFGRTWSEPESRAGAVPRGLGRLAQAHLADPPGRAERAGRALLRRRAGGAVRVARRRARPGRWCAGSATTRTARSGSRAAAGSACTRSCPTRASPSACTSRSPPAASTAPTTAARPGSRATRACAPSSCPTSIPSSASACTRSCSHPSAPGAAVPAEPLGPLPQRRRRRHVAGHRQRRALRLRLRHGHASARPRHGLHRAARVRRVPLHARGQAARLPHRATRGALVGAARQRAAAEERLRDRAARRAGRRPRSTPPASTSARAAASSSARATRAIAGRWSSTDCRP